MNPAIPYQLSCRSGVLHGSRFDIQPILTLGREATCDLVLDDPKVSRHHASLLYEKGKFLLEDKQSTNGSLVNGKRVTEQEVHLGDIIKIGGSEFCIVELDDFRSISFVQTDSMVTSVVNTTSIRPDALAAKFAQIFEYYKENQPEISDIERVEIVRTQRMLNGLKTTYAISQSMTQLAPVKELLQQIGENVFELFAGAENLAILLEDPATNLLVPRFACTRDKNEEPTINISRTVLDRAVREKSTLVANDAGHDERLAKSDSIIGFSVKSVMCAPLVNNDKVLGALYLDNRLLNINYDDLDAELLTAFANQCAIAIENAYLCDTLQSHYHQTLQALVNAIEAKDSYTMGHTARVAKYATGIARSYGIDEERIKVLKRAADLHDIGKIGVKEGIINKAGKLTDTEFVSIKDHVELGEKILKPITYLHDILPIIRGHHEKWDGSGYPDGLKGEATPLEGRILALADALDAMTSQRSYNKPMSFSEALGKIKEASGTQFDPKVVSAYEKYHNDVLINEAEEDSCSISTSQPMNDLLAAIRKNS